MAWTVIARICVAAVAMSPPAVLRLMNPCTAKVDGKNQETTFQKAGKATDGQLHPVRKMATGEMARKSTNTLSRRVMTVLHIMLKKTQSVTKISSSDRTSSKSPRWGMPKMAGTMKVMYMPMARYSSQ